MKFRSRFSLTVALLIAIISSDPSFPCRGFAAETKTFETPLSFSTANESMWGGNNTLESQSFSLTIIDQHFPDESLDAMGTVPNPLWEAWDLLKQSCLLTGHTVEECISGNVPTPEYLAWLAGIESCTALGFTENQCITGASITNPLWLTWDTCMTACNAITLVDFTDAQCISGYTASYPNPEYPAWKTCYDTCRDYGFTSTQCKSTGSIKICLIPNPFGGCLQYLTINACGPTEPSSLSVTVPACGSEPATTISTPGIGSAPAQYFNIGPEPSPKEFENGARIDVTKAYLKGGFKGELALGHGTVDSSYESMARITVEQAPAAGQLVNISTTKVAEETGSPTLVTNLSGIEARLSSFMHSIGKVHFRAVAAGDEIADETLVDFDTGLLEQEIAELLVGGSGDNLAMKLFGEEIFSVHAPGIGTNIPVPGVLPPPYNALIGFPMADVAIYLPELSTPPNSEVDPANLDKVSNTQLPVERWTLCTIDSCPEGTRIDFGKIDVDFDVATVVAGFLSNGTPIPLGATAGIPLIANVELNVEDWDAGTFFSLAQDLDLTVNGIDVNLDFSKPLEVETNPGVFECRQSHTFKLGEGMSFRYPGGPLDIIPTFELQNDFHNKTVLYLQPAQTTTYLQLKFGGVLFSAIGGAAETTLDWSVYKGEIPLWPEPIPVLTFYEGTSSLNGFNTIVGESITYNTPPGNDACSLDDDDDGVLDAEDAYPLISLDGRTDTDGDGRPDDCDEICQATGMTADDDDDNDDMPDSWEVDNALNPLKNDAGDDPDQDGFTNLTEYNEGTDPQNMNSHPPRGLPWLFLLLTNDE